LIRNESSTQDGNDACWVSPMSLYRWSMARVDLRNEANATGDWFVDTRCIDCGTCRDIAPDLFAERSGLSVVRRQPSDGEDAHAWLAAQACPTLSIGTISRRPRPGRLYPREIEAGSGVFDLGYCSEDSFGASAWLIVRPAGNVLVDSPRFTEALARSLDELGGVRHVVFTHRDDVADGRRWCERFRARSWIHIDDRAGAPWTTDVLTEER
jgi:ferredoxin